jgi:DNA (cytosine-5)-methyltransferase 1
VSALSRAEIFERVDELLEAKYRSADLGNLEDPLAESVYILLSQQTRESAYQRVFKELRRRYPTWTSLLRAPDAALERLLAPAGFQRRRTATLRRFLEAVLAANSERGIGPAASPARDLTLGFLRRMTDGNAEDFLRSLPGIGPKTARCVMSYALGRETFAVDTNIHRIFSRMGIVPSRGRKADHDPFQKVVPAKLRKRLHVNLIHHGRAVCTPGGKPRCGDCILVSFCKTGRARIRTDNAPVAVDLFAGAGGLGAGFRSAGYRVAVAVEADRAAAQTYRYNNPGVPVLETRIGARSSAAQLLRAVPGLTKVDAVIAGPPCQGYSAAGSRAGDDPRNGLYRHVVRLAAQLKARLIVLEQVPGVRKVDGLQFAERIKRSFTTAGYSPREYLLRASDFGVPQRRQRILFVGRRGPRLPPLPPPPTHRQFSTETPKRASRLPMTVSLIDALRQIPVLGPGRVAERLLRNEREFLNMSTMRHAVRVLRKIAAIQPGEGPISYRRLDRGEARTLIAGHRAFPVHPRLDRTISVREAALIQGFPVDYLFCGVRAAQPLQVANAVPPPLAAAVAAHLKPLLLPPR